MMMQNTFHPIDPAEEGTVLWGKFNKDWRRSDADVPVQLYWRSSDGFGQLFPRPDPALVATFYEAEYYTHGTGERSRHTHGAKMSFVQKLIFHLAWRADKSVELTDARLRNLLGSDPADVLEIGCGSGATLERLQKMGHRCVGIEPDPAALAETKRRHVTAYPGVAEDIPPELASKSFDLIMMLHVLERCVDPEQAMQNAYDLLKPGGRLIVEVPNNDCKGLTYFGKSWLWLDIPRHLNFFTRESLSALFSKTGLTDTSVQYRGYNRQFSTSWLDQQANVAAAHDTPPLGSAFAQARYLMQTIFVPENKKYDSVRLVAKRPDTPSLT